MHVKIIVVVIVSIAICAALPDRHGRGRHDFDRTIHHGNYREQDSSYVNQETIDDIEPIHQNHAEHKADTHRRQHKIAHHTSIIQSTFSQEISSYSPGVHKNIANLNPFRISAGRPVQIQETVHENNGQEHLQSRFQNSDRTEHKNMENVHKNNHRKIKPQHNQQHIADYNDDNPSKNVQYQNMNPGLIEILSKVVSVLSKVDNTQSDDDEKKSTTNNILDEYSFQYEGYYKDVDSLNKDPNNLNVINNTESNAEVNLQNDTYENEKTVVIEHENIPQTEKEETLSRTENEKNIKSYNITEPSNITSVATKENAGEVTEKNSELEIKNIPSSCQLNDNKDTTPSTLPDSEKTEQSNNKPDSVTDKEVLENGCEEDLKIDDRFGAGVVASLLG